MKQIKYKFNIEDKAGDIYSAVFLIGADFPIMDGLTLDQKINQFTNYFKSCLEGSSYTGRRGSIESMTIQRGRTKRLSKIKIKMVAPPDLSIKEMGIDDPVIEMTFRFFILESIKKHEAIFKMGTDFPLYEIHKLKPRRDLIAQMIYSYLAGLNDTGLSISSEVELRDPESGQVKIEKAKPVSINRKGN